MPGEWVAEPGTCTQKPYSRLCPLPTPPQSDSGSEKKKKKERENEYNYLIDLPKQLAYSWQGAKSSGGKPIL